MESLCLLALGVVGDTLFVLLDDNPLVMRWHFIKVSDMLRHSGRRLV